MQNIRIKSGTYKIRGKDVELAGMVFPMVEGFKVGAQGGYVTVDGTAVAGFPDRNIKIMCANADAYAETTEEVNKTAVEESDDEDERNDYVLNANKSVLMTCVFNHRFKRWQPCDCV